MRNLKSCADSGEEIRASGICDIQTITESHRDFAAAYKNQHGADVFRQILQSFCPSIYGHELVKGIFPILSCFPSLPCIISELQDISQLITVVTDLFILLLLS